MRAKDLIQSVSLRVHRLLHTLLIDVGVVGQFLRSALMVCHLLDMGSEAGSLPCVSFALSSRITDEFVDTLLLVAIDVAHQAATAAVLCTSYNSGWQLIHISIAHLGSKPVFAFLLRSNTSIGCAVDPSVLLHDLFFHLSVTSFCRSIVALDPELFLSRIAHTMKSLTFSVCKLEIAIGNLNTQTVHSPLRVYFVNLFIECVQSLLF